MLIAGSRRGPTRRSGSTCQRDPDRRTRRTGTGRERGRGQARCPRGRGTPRSTGGVDHAGPRGRPRSEEHTSELQSLMRISYAVFCLKKKKSETQKERTKEDQRENK